MYRDILSKKPKMTMVDDFAVNLRTCETYIPVPADYKGIKNTVNRVAQYFTDWGMSKEYISAQVANVVELRGVVGPTAIYACDCNNWGPRWGENSADPCCQGCMNWALDHHYEVPTSELDPCRVTPEMIDRNTWGIRVSKIEDFKANRVHRRVKNYAQQIVEWPFTKEGVTKDE